MAKLRGGEYFPIYFGAKPEGLKLAGELRHNMTPAEYILWQQLRNRKVLGYRFRRQHPVSEFILDFFCYEAMLAIELDGSVHFDSSQKERDIERSVILERLGIKVIRFTNSEIEQNMLSVLEVIKLELTTRAKVNK